MEPKRGTATAAAAPAPTAPQAIIQLRRVGSEGGCISNDSPWVTAEERPNRGPDGLEVELLIERHFRQ